ncbi:DUF3718 domain-containing protein [Thalassotalea aquiviva]|uniref:DUF3718 domain-containing protein n=1 Tax=Thalassotalea aquiviva TaxID=3242415 RepID=UPI00352B7048
MKRFTTAITTLLIASTSFVATANETTPMSSYMEDALIQTCKAAASDRTIKLNKTLKEFRLDEKTVALNVVCNGEDIISFAQNRGAETTATRLNKSIGQSIITDIQLVNSGKYQVNFPVSPK